MKSIQTKIIIIMISILVIFGSVAFFIAYNNTKTVLDANMKTILNLTGDKEKKNLDESLRSIEQSVNTIYNYAYQEIESNQDILTDVFKREEFLEDFGCIAENVAQNTVGTISTYLRFNPSVYDEAGGFWYLYNESSGKWEETPVTDISNYNKDDISHVGWYYVPIKQKMPIWMDPYYNANMDKEIASYVIPFYLNELEVGVIAMDTDVQLLRNSVSDITTYNTGKAFLLMSNGDVVYHKNYPNGSTFSELKEDEQDLVKFILESSYDEVLTYSIDDEELRVVLKKLRNGMILGSYVPLNEVTKPQNILLQRYLVFMCFMLLIAIVTCDIWIRTVTQPLKELTRVVKECETGRFDTNINIKSEDEVGVLADSFRHMAIALKSYIDVINNQAKTDALTGLNNSSAYSQMEEALNKQINDGLVNFTVVVIDVNNLKKVNDSCGHKDGDELIMMVANVIERAFGHRAVFRIGGDEFVAMMRDADEALVMACMDKVNEMLEEHNREFSPEEWRGNVSVAMGMARFSKGIDKSYVDVFNLADERMYQNKRKMKAAMAQARKLHDNKMDNNTDMKMESDLLSKHVLNKDSGSMNNSDSFTVPKNMTEVTPHPDLTPDRTGGTYDE